MHRQNNHHGVNPAIQPLTKRQQKKVLELERRRRETGDWAPWEVLLRQDISETLLRLGGWVGQVGRAYRNRVFCVLVREDASGVRHAAVSSLSGIRPSWYEMQRIKNEIFGEASVAVEVYPAQSDVVDGSDMFHFWVLPGGLPFGLHNVEASRGSATDTARLVLEGLPISTVQ